jgi:hypothetical protein
MNGNTTCLEDRPRNSSANLSYLAPVKITFGNVKEERPEGYELAPLVLLVTRDQYIQLPALMLVQWV